MTFRASPLAALLAALPAVSFAAAADRAPYFGFTPFPYDTTLEAVVKTREIVAENSTIYAFHIDDGIPWEEALEDQPFPDELQRDWKGKADAVPRGHKVYLAITPLDKDRKRLVGASEGSRAPRGFSGANFDDERVMKAYLNYARRAVSTFSPDYLNLGIEAGELARHDRRGWERFTRLFSYVRDELKKTHPSMPIGISFSLHFLMEEEIADRVKPLVEESDYLGLSFYPYASSFGEKFGAEPLPAPPDQWRVPLAWVREYTNKPIAMCETGYSTVNVEVPAYDLRMQGDARLQKDYVEDLDRIAVRDDYLFVIWFLVADYDKLYRKIPEGDGSNRIWRNIGFLDAELEPKPAWESWKQIVSGKPGSAPTAGEPEDRRAPPEEDVEDVADRGGSVVLGVSGKSGLQTNDRLESVEGPQGANAVRWRFDYGGRWHWATRAIEEGRIDGRESLSFWARSDREMPLFVQLEEKSGEAFFELVTVGKEWREVRLELDELAVDPKKRRDGRLDPARVTQILLADNAGVETKVRGERSIWISDFVFDGGSAGRASRRSGSVTGEPLVIGFSEGSRLFESPDEVSLVRGPRGAEASLRWHFDYGGEWHWATLPVERGALDGFTRLRLRIRSDREMPLFVQLEEKDGESFYQILMVGEDWEEKLLELEDLEPDPNKRRDGRLEPGQIVQILIADNAGAEKKLRGERTIWISDLVFER